MAVGRQPQDLDGLGPEVMQELGLLFALDVLRCPGCGGRRRIVGVSGGLLLRELLERLGLGDRSSRAAPGASRVR